MCGVFGFITKNGKGPDLTLLRRIAIETQQRGPHAFGLAWIGTEGAIHTFKRPGPATDNLGDLNACRGAAAVIGHCRWATHGEPEVNSNNHPHRAGRGWIVHNGVITNHVDLIRHYKLSPKTECDSEVLGLLVARFSGTLESRVARAVDAVEGPLVMLGLWCKPTRLLIVRRGNPLCFGSTSAGYYFSSLPPGLPGKVFSTKNPYAGMLMNDSGVYHSRFTIGGF